MKSLIGGKKGSLHPFIGKNYLSPLNRGLVQWLERWLNYDSLQDINRSFNFKATRDVGSNPTSATKFINSYQ